MRERLVGSALGRAALFLREKKTLLQSAYHGSESLGTLANDHLATRLVSAICASGRTFVDVGAHIGSVIADVAHRDRSIRIVAIEAVPDKAARLRRKFPGVAVHDCAAGENDGRVAFFVDKRASAYSSLGRRAASAVDADLVEIEVPMKRLDELVSTNDVDVIKIDVEGAELGVLRGAPRILDNDRPTLMFESGPQENDGLGYSKEALHGFLTAHRYAVLVPNRLAHNDPGLGLAGFVDSHLYPRRTTNYFAVAIERRDELRRKARAVLGLPGA